MGYIEDESMVRVDFFKESGKWYTTEAIKWEHYSGYEIHYAFRYALEQHLQGRLKGMTAICLEPYHEHSHPVSMVY